jgi:endogenous inhibitor of DNA gyrase (YacG/DUF329 family)
MGILITTESLNQKNACPEAYAFFTGSFCVSGSQWYSGSNHEAYFEENTIYPFTCSKSVEVDWLIWAANKFKITGSFYNSETKVSQKYHNTNYAPTYTEHLPSSGSE